MRQLFLLIAFTIIGSTVRAQTPNWPNQNQMAPNSSFTLISLPDAYNSVSGNTPQNFNYTRSWRVRKPVTNSASIMETTSADAVTQTTEYYDGFGNTIQKIIKGGANGFKDRVEFSDYRVLNDKYSFLPYSVSQHGVKFRMNPYAEQRAFYTTNFPNDVGASYGHLKQTTTNGIRKMTSYSPGRSNVGSGYRGVDEYQNIAGSSIPLLRVDAQGSFVNGGFYGNNQLVEKRIVDEQGAEVLEYRNKSGQIICRKVSVGPCGNASNCPSWATTYYVYDDFDRLIHEITPKAYNSFIAINWSQTTMFSSILKNLCITNLYDNQGRHIETQIPGKATTDKYVYDSKDRLILFQDGLLQQTSQWKFNIYDNLDRVIASGLYTDTRTRSQIQGFIDNIGNGAYGFTNTLQPYFIYGSNQSQISSVAVGDAEFHIYNYYDDYSNAAISGRALNTVHLNQALGQHDNYSSVYYYSVPHLTHSLRGLLTGSKIKVLKPSGSNLNDWITSVNFYDQERRLIQTQTLNPFTTNGNWDCRSYLYDFEGRLLRDLHSHYNNNSTPAQVTVHKAIEYNPKTFTVKKIKQKLDNHQWMEIEHNTYEVNTGRKHSTNLGGNVESQVYSYDMKGRLIGINEYYTLHGVGTDMTFGEFIGYDYGFTKPRFNGTVSGIIWRGPDASPMRSYAYEYDAANRLTRARFYEWIDPSGGTAPTWNTVNTNYTEENITYDLNGNLSTIQRWGMNGSSPLLVDDLSLPIGISNQLATVEDNVTPNTTAGVNYDFKGHSGGTSVYEYDYNGNLEIDPDRQITTEYNYLNKPTSITFDNSNYSGDKIEYVYDAQGNKLQEIASIGSTTSTTSYWGGITYKNAELYFIAHEHGYATRKAANDYDYYYFAKDHLGNVRNVLHAQLGPIGYQYLAQHEVASANLENAIFDNIDNVRGTKPESSDPGDTEAAILNGADPDRRIGTALILRVMAGDQFRLSTESYYGEVPDGMENVTAEAMLTSITSTLVGGSGGYEGGEEGNGAITVDNLFTTDNYLNSFNEILDDHTDLSRPAAHLNFILFDENYRVVGDQSGAIQVGQNSGVWETLTTGTMPITVGQSGYLAVFLSNGSNIDVAMDDFMIEVWKGKLVEENHYYPFGTTVRLSSTNPLANRYLYQTKGIEVTHGLHLYDFHARQYDPQLGRFMSVDPAGQFASGYIGMGNYPVMGVDPDGEWVHIVVGAVIGGIVNVGIQVMKGNVNGGLDALKAFGVGALAGGIGAATGGAALGIYTGYGAGAGIMGTVTLGTGGFAGGAVSGAAGGAVSAGILTTGNAVMLNDYDPNKPFGEQLAKSMILGAATGAILGGTVNGLAAKKIGSSFWTGSSGGNSPAPPKPDLKLTNFSNKKVNADVEGDLNKALSEWNKIRAQYGQPPSTIRDLNNFKPEGFNVRLPDGSQVSASFYSGGTTNSTGFNIKLDVITPPSLPTYMPSVYIRYR